MGAMGAIVAIGAIAAIVAASILGGLAAGSALGNHSTVVAGNAAAVEHTISVSGVGEVSVAPDVADVVVGVVVQKPTVAEAQSAQATAMSAVVAAVKSNHVDDKDIVTINLSLSPVYDYSAEAPGLSVRQHRQDHGPEHQVGGRRSRRRGRGRVHDGQRHQLPPR
jgi:hypothetical protein